MDLKELMDVLFDMLNESDRLEIANIDTDYHAQCFYVTLRGGKVVRIDFRE